MLLSFVTVWNNLRIIMTEPKYFYHTLKAVRAFRIATQTEPIGEVPTWELIMLALFLWEQWVYFPIISHIKLVCSGGGTNYASGRTILSFFRFFSLTHYLPHYSSWYIMGIMPRGMEWFKKLLMTSHAASSHATPHQLPHIIRWVSYHFISLPVAFNKPWSWKPD